MKTLITAIAMLCITLTGYTQSSIFDKFEDMDDVTTIVVTKELFKMASKFNFSSNNPEAKEYEDMVKNLESLKVFTTDKSSIAEEMNTVVSKYLKSSKLTELMRVKDKDAKVKVYIRQGKDEDHVSELLMFVKDMSANSNKEAVILSLTGNIDLNSISKLTEAHIPNSDKHLKKTN